MGSPEENNKTVKAKARVFLVEDHEITRFGLVQLVNQQNDLVVCGEADNVSQALGSIPKANPDLVAMDLTLKKSKGLEMIKTLSAQSPHLPVLVISMHDETVHAEMALHAGARGYITKAEAIGKVLQAMRQVLAGKIYLSEQMTERFVEKQTNRRSNVITNPIGMLSERELAVLQFVGEWRRTIDIAAELHLSVKTIEYYKQRIKSKLGFVNATELARFATRWVQHDTAG